MSLIRFIVLLGAVFVLLPSDAEQRGRLWERSQDLASWTMTTCERNPRSCEFATDIWDRVKDKSVQGLVVINDMAKNHVTSMPEPSTPIFLAFLGGGLANGDTGTLSQDDLVPDWRGDLETGN